MRGSADAFLGCCPPINEASQRAYLIIRRRARFAMRTPRNVPLNSFLPPLNEKRRK